MSKAKKASDALRERYEAAADAFQTHFSNLNERVLEGHSLTDEEKAETDRLRSAVDSAKLDWSDQRDLEAMAESVTEDRAQVEAEIAKATAAVTAQTESVRGAVLDGLGRDGLDAYDQRTAEQFDMFQRIADTRDKSLVLDLNPEAARNFAKVSAAGVSPADYVAAVRSGQHMQAVRNAEGRTDVRVYTAGANTASIIPTYWDTTLYLFKSWIGGVEAAGADVIPVEGINAVRLPQVTAYHSTPASPGAEGVANTNDVQDTVGYTELTPRPYRAHSAETDELRRSASIDTRMQLVLRSLGRALQLGKETDWHNGTGTGEPLGILTGVDNTATPNATNFPNLVATGGNTAGLGYGSIPDALGLLDTEYHLMGGPGVVSLIGTVTWFRDFVGKTADGAGQNGQALYPFLANGGNNIFGTRVQFSSQIHNSTPAANRVLAVVGSFMDAYVIASSGNTEIRASDDDRFLQWERVFSIQEYADGKPRDRRALSYIRSKA